MGDLQACVTQALMQLAPQIARAMVLSIRRDFQGAFYIPKNTALAREKRNAALIADHQKGVSAKKLAAEYGLGVRQVYAILRRCRQCSPLEDNAQQNQ